MGARGGETPEELMRAAAKLREEAGKLEGTEAKQRQDQRRKIFDSYDSNRNGKIELGELQNAMRIDAGEAAELMREHDKNRDGALQFDEFDEKALDSTLNRIRREKEYEARQEQAKKQQAAAAERRNFNNNDSMSNPMEGGPGPLEAVAFAAVAAEVVGFGLLAAFTFNQLGQNQARPSGYDSGAAQMQRESDRNSQELTQLRKDLENLRKK